MSRLARSKPLKRAHLEQDGPAGSAVARRPAVGPYADILTLQRTIGNRAVSQLLESGWGSAPHAVDAVPPIVHEVLRSPGQPLDPPTRVFMESRFGHEFSQVRVHTDAKAAESARAVNALAYTVGRDVVLGAGQYAPRTIEGKWLLAHELTHVMHQAGGGPVIQRQDDESAGGGPGPVVEAVGDVSVYAGVTMTAEAALREIYTQGARQISEQALRMAAEGTSVEYAARWAVEARNDLKVAIRAKGSPITRGLAEARNIRKYGNKIGPSYDDLIREGKTPQDIIGSAGRANQKVSRVATRLRVAGRFLIAVDLAIVTWEVISAPEGERLKTAVAGAGGIAGAAAGGWAGAKGGAAVGAFIGSFFGPGPGTAIGGAVGGIIGGVGGAIVGGLAGRAAGEAAYEFVEELVTPNLDAQMREIDAAEDAYIRGRGR